MLKEIHLLKIGSAVLTIAAATIGLAGSATAYNRNAAANYADGYAMSRNTNYPSFSADCANFVSQSLVAGGYPQVNGDGNAQNNNNWFMNKPWYQWWWNYSNTWTVAANQYQFQMLHYPGGWLYDTVKASDARYWYAYDNPNIWQGDELFFNWSNDTNPANINHMGIQTYGGASWYNGVVGDREDQHINDRYHARWNLTDVNSNPMTTVIREVQIDNRN